VDEYLLVPKTQRSYSTRLFSKLVSAAPPNRNMPRSNRVRSRPTTHGTDFGAQISIGDIICKHGAG
jgi:hypothetical protein